MALRSCIAEGCETLTAGSRCGAHQLVRVRPTRKDRGYTEAWYGKVRAAIQAQPWCTWCRATEDLTGDHPIPLSLGGSADQDPIVVCRPCNSRRGAGPLPG